MVHGSAERQAHVFRVLYYLDNHLAVSAPAQSHQVAAAGLKPAAPPRLRTHRTKTKYRQVFRGTSDGVLGVLVIASYVCMCVTVVMVY